MKAAIIKQGTSATFATWESVRYPGPEKLLDAFVFKSHFWPMMVEMEADVWVIEGDTVIPQSFVETSRQTAPYYIPAILRQHKNKVPWSAVPWDEYDVVISVLPIVPAKIVKRHPQILWCYYTIGHTTKLFRKSLGHPYGAYDLFLDHSLCATSRVHRLPQAIAFPYPTNPDLMKKHIGPTNEPAVFLDSRLVVQYEKNPARFAALCNLPVKHSPVRATQKRLMNRTFTEARGFLEALGSCKYLLMARKSGFIGQGSLEGAALDVIVISGLGCYTRHVCHPAALIEAGNAKQGLKRILVLQKDLDLQKEILAHQEAVLWDRFWKRPLDILEKALEMKREC